MTVQGEPDERFGGVDRMLDSIRNGDHALLGPLLGLYGGFLLQLARRKLSPEFSMKVSPSDVVQDSLIDATRGFAEFKGTSEAEVRVWLGRILENRVVDVHRHFHQTLKRDISREIPFEDEAQIVGDKRYGPTRAGTPPGEVIADELNLHIEIAFEKLNLDDREIITLRIFEGLTFSEIGARLEISEDAARARWLQALRRLRVILMEMRRDDSSFGR